MKYLLKTFFFIAVTTLSVQASDLGQAEELRQKLNRKWALEMGAMEAINEGRLDIYLGEEMLTPLRVLVTMAERPECGKGSKLGLIEEVLRKGADVNFFYSEKNSPLICALRHGEFKIAELFIKYGAGTDYLSWDQILRDIFLEMIRPEDPSLFSLTLTISDITAFPYNNPYKPAPFYGFLSCMKFAIEQGANPFALIKGKTLLDIVEESRPFRCYTSYDDLLGLLRILDLLPDRDTINLAEFLQDSPEA